MPSCVRCPICLTIIKIEANKDHGECENRDCPHKIQYLLFNDKGTRLDSRNKTASWFPKTTFETNADCTKKYGFFYSNSPVEKYFIKKGSPLKRLFAEEFFQVWIDGISKIGLPHSLFELVYPGKNFPYEFEALVTSFTFDTNKECKTCKEYKDSPACTNSHSLMCAKIDELAVKFGGLSSIKDVLKKSFCPNTNTVHKEAQEIYETLCYKCWQDMSIYGVPIIIHDTLIGIAILFTKVSQDRINETTEDYPIVTAEAARENWNKLVKCALNISDVGEQIHLMLRSTRDNLFREEIMNKFDNIAKYEINNYRFFIEKTMELCFSRICEYTLFEKVLIYQFEPNKSFSLVASYPISEKPVKNIECELNTTEDNFISIRQGNPEERTRIDKLQKLINIKIDNILFITISDTLFMYINRKYPTQQPLDTISNRSVSFMNSLSLMLNTECQRIKDLHVREEFLRDIAHNFRTPLSFLNNLLTEMVNKYYCDGFNDDYFKDFIRRVDASISLLGVETSRFLTAYKVETLKKMGSIYTEDIVLKEIIKEAEDIFSVITQPNNITFKSVFPMGKDAKIKSNKEFVALVINILFENAVKYSTDNTHIESIVSAATNGWHLSIANFGIGIDCDEMETLFTIGKRGKWATVYKPTAGTGRGLAILKKVLEAIGGKVIKVESFFGGDKNFVPGTGYKTTFIIWLPYNI